ncbi:zinc finger protein-like [Tropilaelaps mercedesae]|uniref:Zinc finger protein-like n=1 Tax=Tropilaelaps mercedesae TaxID=418985 RepID=A0A1V9XVW9_9ACAR|nr:zinc finger protein-like [Tropilaelaps mercedesae]
MHHAVVAVNKETSMFKPRKLTISLVEQKTDSEGTPLVIGFDSEFISKEDSELISKEASEEDETSKPLITNNDKRCKPYTFMGNQRLVLQNPAACFDKQAAQESTTDPAIFLPNSKSTVKSKLKWKPWDLLWAFPSSSQANACPAGSCLGKKHQLMAATSNGSSRADSCHSLHTLIDMEGTLVLLLPGQIVPEGFVSVPICSWKVIKCPFCTASFSAVDELGKHVLGLHASRSNVGELDFEPPSGDLVDTSEEVSKVACPPIVVSRKSNVISRKTHVCDVCHKTFNQKGHLINHFRVHTGERPYECELCHKRFSQTGHLVSHMNSHTNTRPYGCRYCQRRFTQSGHMRNHERLHLGLRPYQCGQCGKSFTQSGHLVNHMRLHEGSKPFRCSFCGKRFTQSGHLTNHVRSHGNEKGHRCPGCNKIFSKAGVTKYLDGSTLASYTYNISLRVLMLLLCC